MALVLEKPVNLEISPRYELAAVPDLIILRADGNPRELSLRAVVTNRFPGPGSGPLSVDAPAGWKVSLNEDSFAIAAEDAVLKLEFEVEGRSAEVTQPTT